MKFFLQFFVCFFLSFCFFSGQAQIVINEFSGANYTEDFDNYGETEDWVELYNTGNAAVDLSGYHLSDRLTNPDKWAFPAGVSIPAQGFLLIWLSDRDEVIGNNVHASFKLTQTKANEGVVFADPSGAILDYHDVAVPNQTNHSRGRTTDGGAVWGVLTDPTPGGPNTNVSLEYAETPGLSPDAGFYTGSIQVSLSIGGSGLTVHYTTNGDEPTVLDPIYSTPINVAATTVIRAKAFSSNPQEPASFIATNTYFIDASHSIPVISVIGDGLPNLVGGDWGAEPIGHFEYFGYDQQIAAESFGEYNKHGNDSWAYDQRGIDFITRDQMGYDYAVRDELFPSKDRDEYQRLIIKAGANDNYPFEFGGAYIRDAYVHVLSQEAGMELDERSYVPCAMYMNGQYWGLYEIREKVDDNDFTSHYYDQGRKWLDFIKTWGNTWEEYGSSADWYPLQNFIVSNNMADSANYAYVEERFELESLVDYMILNTHVVCQDWLNWNTAWWRGNNPSGDKKRWRYALWDLDATFGHYINYTGIPDPSSNADPCDNEDIGPFGDPEGHVEMVQSLFDNEDFKELYVNRYADMNNTFFSCDFMLNLLDSMIAQIAPEMPAQVQRWGGSVSGWENNVQALRDFIEDRCVIIDNGIEDCYDVEGPYDLTVVVEPPGSGEVQVNTIIPGSFPFEGDYFGDIDINLKAIASGGLDFAYWEINNNIIAPNVNDPEISINLQGPDTVIAYFLDPVPCSPANGLGTANISTNSATISWVGAPNAVGYSIYYREINAPDWEEISEENDTYQLFGLVDCSDYEFKIGTVCDQGVSEESSIFNFTTECLTIGTLNREEVFQDLKIYPNPFQDFIQLEFNMTDVEDVSVEIMNLNGQLVEKRVLGDLQSGENSLILQTENLITGVYFVRLVSGDAMVIQKIIRQ